MIEAISCGGVVIFRGKILLLYKNIKHNGTAITAIDRALPLLSLLLLPHIYPVTLNRILRLCQQTSVAMPSLAQPTLGTSRAVTLVQSLFFKKKR